LDEDDSLENVIYAKKRSDNRNHWTFLYIALSLRRF
jgi:hypothetical protein